MTDFNTISNRYEKDSLVQKSAGETLFELADIQPGDDVLDLGCGAGNLTHQIRQRTKGSIIGMDASEGMIQKAAEKYGNEIRFIACPAEQMDFQNQFDLIFCNSTFQWFREPEHVLVKCLTALCEGGRMVIQAPARRDYSPSFLEAIDQVATDPRTRETFTTFQSPWNFLETAEDYKAIFERTGFHVRHAIIERNVSSHPPEEAFRIFDSGASAGYLNPAYYTASWPSGYADLFRKIVRDHFAQCAKDGKTELIFHRIFLLAFKPAEV